MKIKFNVLFWFLLSGIIFFRVYGEETVNITTFYPVPSGVYQSLESETLVIGDRDRVDSPSEEGVVRFQPRQEPSRGKSGELYFDEGETRFKYYDGSTWKALGINTGSTCGWFRGECPAGWELPGTGEEYRKQVKNDDLPVSGNQYRYIWRQNNSYMNQTYVCEPRNIDLDNPPTNIVTSGSSRKYSYSYHFCNDCFGDGCTDYVTAYSNSGERIKTTVIGSGICTLYLYRCIYPGDPGEIPIAGVYNMSYCCPSE